MKFFIDCFVVVTEVFIKEFKKGEKYLRDVFEHGTNSIHKSFKLFALQNLNMWLGLYIFCYFLPAKLEASLSWIPSTNVAYIGFKPFLLYYLTSRINAICPTGPVTAFQVSMQKSFCLLAIYLCILVWWGRKTISTLFKRLSQSLCLIVNP